MDWLILIAGLVVLLAGGEALVRGATALARSLGVSSMAIGMTVLAFGTSAPELAVNISAPARLAATALPDTAPRECTGRGGPR